MGRQSDLSPTSTWDLIREGITEAEDGKSTLILLETPEGTIGTDEAVGVERVVCAASCGAEPGRLAEALDLEKTENQVIFVEEAQWADATSLGRLQRILGSEDRATLVVLAHRPLTDANDWAIEQLRSGLPDRVRIESVSAESTTRPVDISDLPTEALDLLAACSLTTGALPVTLAARVVNTNEEELLSTGEQLATVGLLAEGRGGFVATATGSAAIMSHEARMGNVARRLADVVAADGGGDGRIGQLRLEAGQPDLAVPLLRTAAIQAASEHANSEAHRLARSALDAASQSGATSDPEYESTMHVICARFLRSAGRTAAAQEHAMKAIAMGTRENLAEALHLAAQLADDSQRPQQAEQLIAMAQLQAARGRNEQLASLLGFHARVLNRIGFALESDAVLAKAEIMAAGLQDAQTSFGVSLNKAWMHFDRGEMGWASHEFTRLRDQAERVEGRDSLADKEAWRARSLFASGHPDEALEAVASALEIAAETGVEAPLFLADLAIAEGAPIYGRHAEAVEAAERAIDLVVRQLPSWENMALTTRGRARLQAGDFTGAQGDFDAALTSTPPGADGWRWRLRAHALAIESAAISGEAWSETELEDIADQLLQAKLYGWAAETLCAIAEHGNRPSAASDAMRVALYADQPVLAARAVHAGGLWEAEESAAVILAIKAMADRVPSDWLDTWAEQAHIRAALDRPAPVEDPDLELAARAMRESLAQAGLAPDTTILSPAQRRSSGLVAGSPGPRRFKVWWAVAAALGVVVLAGGTAWGITQLTDADQPTDATGLAASETPSTVAEVLTLEETQIAVPESMNPLFGTSVFRGSYERTGLVDAAGPREINGYYWRFQTAGPIEAAPITYGTSVYVGTTEGTFYNLDQTTGDEIWTMPPDGRIAVAPGLGQGETTENQSPMMVVVVDDNGVVRGRDAAVANGINWSAQLGERIRSSPVVADGRVYVASSDGYVYALDLIDGSELWRYPSEGEGLGEITADLSLHDGVLYLGTGSNIMHLLDVAAETPSEVCQFDALAPIVTAPIITEEAVYVGTTGQNIWTLPVGACAGVVPNRLPFYVSDIPVRVPPAIVGDTMYLPAGRYLYSIHLPTNEHQWPASHVTTESPISTPPVVSGDTVYFASEDGVVRAVDSTDGNTLWTWTTGLHVRAAPAVADGVVFVAGGDGYVYALGPG